MQLKLLKAARTPDDIPFVEMGDGIMRRELDIHHIVGFECEDGNFDIENNEENREILRLIMKGESMRTQKIIKAFERIGLSVFMDFVEDYTNSYFILKVKDVGRGYNRMLVEIQEHRDSVDIYFHDDLRLLNSEKTAGIIKILYELVIKENE